jgi:hypothetical protein
MSKTKFDNNLGKPSRNPPVAKRRYFYRVKTTATPVGDNLSVSGHAGDAADPQVCAV